MFLIFLVTGHPCSLFCKPKNPRYRFSAKLASKVIDGTPCRPGSVDICVNGRCQVKNTTLYIWKNARFFKWPSLMLFITHLHTHTHVARFSVKAICRDRKLDTKLRHFWSPPNLVHRKLEINGTHSSAWGKCDRMKISTVHKKLDTTLVGRCMRLCFLVIGHFRVTPNLCFKARRDAKLLTFAWDSFSQGRFFT